MKTYRIYITRQVRRHASIDVQACDPQGAVNSLRGPDGEFVSGISWGELDVPSEPETVEIPRSVYSEDDNWEWDVDAEGRVENPPEKGG